MRNNISVTVLEKKTSENPNLYKVHICDESLYREIHNPNTLILNIPNMERYFINTNSSWT